MCDSDTVIADSPQDEVCNLTLATSTRRRESVDQEVPSSNAIPEDEKCYIWASRLRDRTDYLENQLDQLRPILKRTLDEAVAQLSIRIEEFSNEMRDEIQAIRTVFQGPEMRKNSEVDKGTKRKCRHDNDADPEYPIEGQTNKETDEVPSKKRRYKRTKKGLLTSC